MRELKRVVRMAVLHTEGDTVTADALEFDAIPLVTDASLALEDMEKTRILRALERANGNRKLAVQQDESIRNRIKNERNMKDIRVKKLPL